MTTSTELAAPTGPGVDVLLAGLENEVEAFHQLSRACAARGDRRNAVLAMWASDVRVLHCLLWESGLGAAPDPREELRTCAEAVLGGLRSEARSGHPATTARTLLDAVRAALVAVFDPSVHELLTARFRSADHLDAIGRHQASDDVHPAFDRLAGRSPDQLLVDLRAAAEDSVIVAQALAGEGDFEEADRQLWHATLAAFEAFLVDSAVNAGDERLLTVHLRWEQSAQVLAEGPALGRADAPWLRERLVAVSGPVAGPQFEAELDRSGTWPE